MSATSFSLWVSLSHTPLLWLTATLLCFLLANYISQKSGRFRIVVNAPILATIMLGIVLVYTGTKYETYFEGAQFVHFLLGPTTVALGIPLYENRGIIRKSLLPTSIALVVGAAVATGSALVIGKLMGGSNVLLITMAPKSVTTPVAMGISETLGGDPALTVTIVMCTALIGIISVGPLMKLLGITDLRARGLAIGVTSHGMGTAYAFSENQVTGSFSGIGMGISTFVTAAIIPVFLKMMGII